jgi:hypothetical protein
MLANQVHLGNRADSNEKTANQAVTGLTTANNQIVGLTKSVDEANRRLTAAGKPTVPVPTATQIPVPQLPDGLTASQTAEVRQVVVTELAQQKVVLPPDEVAQIARVAASLVPKPKDGVTPTAAQLQAIATAAVAAYCADDRCVGKQGKPGKPGEQGEPGATVTGAPGKDAPPVTDAQLAAQVAAYCAGDTHPCQGPTGPAGATGATGATGAAGRGVVSGPTCVGTGADSYWLTRYSDDTEQRQDGPCRLAPIVPTPPTTTGETPNARARTTAR